MPSRVYPHPSLRNDGIYSRLDFESGASIYSHDVNGNTFIDAPGAIRLQALGSVVYTNQRFEARDEFIVGLAPTEETFFPNTRGTPGQVLTHDGSNRATWEDPTGGIDDAPQDGQNYVRNNGAWVVLGDTLQLR